MSESYRLVFRGEVLQGQHPAVVRRKLGQLLSLDDARLDRLFAGQTVVVKDAADQEYAARLQALFQKAGARLRVVPIAEVPDPGESSVGADSDGGAAEVTGASAALEAEVLPVGSDVLREDERMVWQPRDIDTSHLALADPSLPLGDPAPPAPPAPDTSKLSLLDLP